MKGLNLIMIQTMCTSGETCEVSKYYKQPTRRVGIVNIGYR